ncbi:hypothetical protein V8065_004562 [Vibrio parahaemolyticus]
MSYKTLLTLLVSLVLSNNVIASQIFKCKKGDDFVFQDIPCAEDFDYGIGDIDTFDSWKYGMNILAVKKEAKFRKLPISPGQLSVVGKYNERLVNSQPDARLYTYHAMVAGKNTKITLFFTQNTQKLYKIKVSFVVSQLPVEEKNYFYSSLVNQLTSKYGTYIEARNYPTSSNLVSKLILKDLVGTEKVWGLKSDNVVSLTGNTPFQVMYELNYKYIPLLKQSVLETTQAIQERTDKELIKHASKL